MKQRLLVLAFLWIFCSISLSVDAHTFTGTVTRVIDGDTICVNRRLSAVSNCLFRVRLAEIDAPEKNQPYGQEAKAALSETIFGRQVVVEWGKKDRYRRIIGTVFLAKRSCSPVVPLSRGRRSINHEMVMRGFAWHYRRYSQSQSLAQAEQNARAHNLGLWKLSAPRPPWTHRSRKL